MVLEIDGSYHEGGGQIVRQAVGLAILKARGIKVTNIRKGRKVPGLKNQHKHINSYLGEQCKAVIRGNDIGSTELLFNPGTFVPQSTEIDLKTAASIPLFLQAVLFPLCFSNKRLALTLKGGTDVKWSLPFDYLLHVLLPYIKPFVKNISLRLEKRGYYPKGGGQAELKISPKFKRNDYDSFEEFCQSVGKEVQIVRENRGTLKQIQGVSHAAQSLMNREVAERQAQRCQFALERLGAPVSIKTTYQNTPSPGSGVVVWGSYEREGKEFFEDKDILGGDALGEPKRTAEDVGAAAARMFKKHHQSGASIDTHIADNLIPWLIFGGRFTAAEISSHTQTSIYTVNQFLDHGKIISEGNTIMFKNL